MKNLIVLKIIGYLFIMGIWIYTRLIVYPRDVIYYGLVVATENNDYKRVVIIILLYFYQLCIFYIYTGLFVNQNGHQFGGK